MAPAGPSLSRKARFRRPQLCRVRPRIVGPVPPPGWGSTVRADTGQEFSSPIRTAGSPVSRLPTNLRALYPHCCRTAGRHPLKTWAAPIGRYFPMERLDRRAFLHRASGLAAAASAGPLHAAEARIGKPLRITDVEALILRDPPERRSEDSFVSMTPLGATTGGVGLWNRLERAETVRQGGYRQTLSSRSPRTRGSWAGANRTQL